jgi:Capsule polysaccharide biosynthesis protein
MNVTVYAPYAAWSPHFETELELMELHLGMGDAVTFITCDAALRFCEANEKHDFSVCAYCVGRAQEGVTRLSRPVRVLRLSELILEAKKSMKGLQPLLHDYSSFAELYQVKAGDFDIGAAVLSSLNSILDDPEPDPSEHRDYTSRSFAAAFAAYAALDRYLDHNPCDLFYFLNGRLANFRAALRACYKHQVRCLIHERGASLESYSLAENTMPHDPAFIRKYVAATLEKAESPDQKRSIAEAFYTERREGKVANWTSFTDYQDRGSLPDGWLDSSIRIAMFSSTESEFACLREYYPTPIYPSQLEGLEMILRDLADKRFAGTFAVRMHPNCVRTRSDFTEKLRALPFPFLRVIAPEDKIDSYALVESAQKVLTWGSTIGIEAAFWRVPSIVVGWAEYNHLGSTYNPASHEEVMGLLLNSLEPKPIAGAIDYGFYCKSYGTPFKYVTPEGPFFALFKGKPVRPPRLRKAFTSETPTRFEKWQRSVWTTWNKGRLQGIYRGHHFGPDPTQLISPAKEKSAESPENE